MGRVEQLDSTTGQSKWINIEKTWIDMYRKRESIVGMSAVKKVTSKDEWICEAYMETDYSTINPEDFQETINNYLSYLVKNGEYYEA